MSRFPAWHFREMDPGEVHVDPVHDEFFRMQDLADALVRESVQNSLDARRGRSPVRVRFHFGVGAEALSPEAARQYFVGLREHLEAASIPLIPDENEPVPYLLIEDFGTRGLTGDPSVDPELEDDAETKNDFYYFWRNVGRSNKAELDRGRWGLGKAVFSVSSRIRTIFGLTRRAEDNRSLLLGQSVLKTHIIDGKRRYPYGFFARFEKRDGLPLPFEDPLLLERFADDFRLRRGEPGLSVVIPHFRSDELSFERIVESAIRQYFYAVTRGDLVIDIDNGGRSESVTAKSIEDIARRYLGDTAESVLRFVALTRWSLTDANDEIIPLATDKMSKWNESVVDETTLGAIRDRFERGQRIAVRVPILVKRKKSKPASSYFDVFLEKDDALKKGEFNFIRRGITIPDVKGTAAADKPVRALVIVDHEAVSTFLGDAENPAHSDWSERAEKLKLLYDVHAGTLRLVKNSAAFLSALFMRPPGGRVRDFLQDIFSIEAPGEEQFPAARLPIAKAKGGETDGVAPAEGGASSSIAISRVADGFTIRGADDQMVGRPMAAELAYRVRSGNPFRKHSAFDFDVTGKDLSLVAEGAQVVASNANRIDFTPTSGRFHITMKGFDPHRDLVIHIFQKAEDAPETELH